MKRRNLMKNKIFKHVLLFNILCAELNLNDQKAYRPRRTDGSKETAALLKKSDILLLTVQEVLAQFV